MIGLGPSWASFVNTSTDLTDKERSPPPSPTPLDFPQTVPQPQAHELTQKLLREVRATLLGFRTPGDVRREHLEALNVKVTSAVAISDLLPDASKRQRRVEIEENAPTEPVRLSNGHPPPSQDKYDLLERELQYDNHEAFRELFRLEPPPGRKRLRITQTRKFWGGLEKMALYWDTSADRFYEGPADAKRVKIEDTRLPPGSDSESATRDAMNIDHEPLTESNASPEVKTESRTRYKGRRTSNGSQMPEEMREDTARAFVEMAAWAFGCQVVMPSVPPRLNVDGLLFPVRQSFTVNRSPADRTMARKGHMEGPLFSIQCKNETSFRSAEDRIGDGSGEAADLFREVGAMLLTAQERARQGQTEKLAGVGKWWTTAPRWGGGPGGDPELPEEGLPIVADEPPPSNSEKEKRPQSRRPADMDMLRVRTEKRSARKGTSSAAAKRLALIDKWKVLRHSSSVWSEKLKYLQIGKVVEDDFDDIYLVSSINHHLSILHLRVHSNYLLWLSGEKVGPANKDSDEDLKSEVSRILHVHRTRWYDLFIPDDRVEALKALWNIMEWMMRGGETGELKESSSTSRPSTPTTPGEHERGVGRHTRGPLPSMASFKALDIEGNSTPGESGSTSSTVIRKWNPPTLE